MWVKLEVYDELTCVGLADEEESVSGCSKKDGEGRVQLLCGKKSSI